jgi:short-subunit dehydrogenase
MVAQGEGKVLITGSIAGFIPGSFQAVYNGTKAFIDSFADALRNELKDEKGITITTLMPGATETEFFDRADMMDTKVGQQEKDDAGKVARDGWNALMKGDAHIVSGWKNKLQAAAAHVTPAAVMAQQHRHMAEPGTAEKTK